MPIITRYLCKVRDRETERGKEGERGEKEPINHIKTQFQESVPGHRQRAALSVEQSY
jgi:hypothetical protein